MLRVGSQPIVIPIRLFLSYPGLRIVSYAFRASLAPPAADLCRFRSISDKKNTLVKPFLYRVFRCDAFWCFQYNWALTALSGVSLNAVGQLLLQVTPAC